MNCAYVSLGINPSTYITELVRSLRSRYELPFVRVHRESQFGEEAICREHNLKFRWIINVNKEGASCLRMMCSTEQGDIGVTH